MQEALVKEKLVGLIDHWAERVIQFTGELIATPSETPPGDERKIAKLILDEFERLGLDGPVVVSEIPERPNVLYRLKGNGRAPTVLYVAHTDTKPVGDVRDQWDTDPFRATIKEGRLYGLGASDMKAAVAAFVYATAALKQVAPMQGDLLLALVADEEGGGRY